MVAAIRTRIVGQISQRQRRRFPLGVRNTVKGWSITVCDNSEDGEVTFS